MLKQVKLLREIYRTYEGARKRCGFENGMARGEYERGDKAKHHRYTVVAANNNTWRVARNVETQQ
jgi:hypothetical protein